MVYCAAWVLLSTVANEGRLALRTPGPVLLNSANKILSVRGSLVDQTDQIALFSLRKGRYEYY
jgi:hypothetical protein